MVILPCQVVLTVVVFADDHDVVSFITHSLTPPKKEGEVITVVFIMSQ